MRARPLAHLVAFCAFALAAAAAEPFTVEIDTSKAPDCAAFAARSKPLVEEWYPKINALLFGADWPLPRKTVKLWFEPMKGVAHTTGDGIHISAEWVTKKAPDDYGMVVHELTHIVQNYRGKGEGWLVEGIADWVRYHHYEPGKKRFQIDAEKNSYRQGYGIAGAFLDWLEKNKAPGFVRRLNIALNQETYRAELFREFCGADLDTLWREFAVEQR